MRPITSQTIDEMKELHIARSALVKDRTAAKNREHACRSPLLKRHAAQRLAQIDRQIDAIDARLKANLQSEPELTARFNILVSIPGIGALTAITMLIEMPELGSLDNKQVASLAGLAPQARDSGLHRGKRHIRGGRAILRQALYMPALVATRYNADMKEQISGARQSWKTRQGRHHRRHAKTHHPRQCAPESKPDVDPKDGLITTDTLDLPIQAKTKPVRAPKRMKNRSARAMPVLEPASA